MKFIAIFAHLFATSLAIPLVAQRLLSASNSNEVLVGVVNPNIPQGGAMNMLVPGVLQNQLRQPGFPQFQFNGQLHPLLTPKLGTQSVVIDPALQKIHQNQQQPNQMMPYIVSYGVPQQQGQVHYYPVYPSEQQPSPAIPKQPANQSPAEQAFGCLVPQFTGEVMKLEMIPSGALQLPTKIPDPLNDDTNVAPEQSKLGDKVNPDTVKAP